MVWSFWFGGSANFMPGGGQVREIQYCEYIANESGNLSLQHLNWGLQDTYGNLVTLFMIL